MILEEFQRITKMNHEKLNENLRFFTKLNIDKKTETFIEQKIIFHNLKNNYNGINNSIITLSSFALAIDKIRKQSNPININVKKIRNKNENYKQKKDKLLSYWSIVQTLKTEEKLSFRDISTYFAKFHRFEISYSTIFIMWNKIEKKENFNEK